MQPSETITPARGRLYIFLAALLWSTSGAFTRVLTQPTFLGTNEPTIETYPWNEYQIPVQIACYRALFAGLFLVPTLRWKDLSFRPLMLVSGFWFAAMNVTFVTAVALGPSANAILLQYSAPLWVYLYFTVLRGEPSDRRSTITMVFGLLGIGIIIAGGWQAGQLGVVAIALASGLSYAGVLVCLRLLRQLSSGWITVWNHFWAGLVLLPLVLTLNRPSPAQFAVMFFFGAFQMGLAYWLAAKCLKAISPQEAGTISLLEPILNPVWAYLVSPETERPSVWTFVGGGIILAALAWRYWPRRKR